ncbi:hypothetical protein RCG17_01805 [Neobacillus sp. PS3-12]|jgi:hypothetical protein|uniref:hypothetical protein n=1 Tax=Neobacillus sp. PS3-12 TaxID=3070677 RepID=UPI0027E05BCD|nr:hypothetical protein [Neobacillus sp. PS3-12]WML53458.1 hypothetical protein RCG17_01805 [Neobacillus sp. PS3-12]
MNHTYPVRVTDGGVLYLRMPEELTLLEDFMIIDLNIMNVLEYLYKIEDSQHGALQQVTGNTTALSITKDKTVVYNTALDQECTLDTQEFKEIIKLYLKENILLLIERDIKKKQNIYEKAKLATSISDFLKLREDLQQDKII